MKKYFVVTACSRNDSWVQYEGINPVKAFKKVQDEITTYESYYTKSEKENSGLYMEVLYLPDNVNIKDTSKLTNAICGCYDKLDYFTESIIEIGSNKVQYNIEEILAYFFGKISILFTSKENKEKINSVISYNEATNTWVCEEKTGKALQEITKDFFNLSEQDMISLAEGNTISINSKNVKYCLSAIFA